MPKNKTIMIVDDSIENIQLMSEHLEDYNLVAANSGKEALELCQGDDLPDLILLDVTMPGGLSGHQVLIKLKEDPRTKNIPVFFVTGLDLMEDENYGLRLGAADYVKKPFSFSILRSRIKTHLRLSKSLALLEAHSIELEEEVSQKESEIKEIQGISLKAIAALAKTRDNETGAHIIRTSGYVNVMGRYIIENKLYEDLTYEKLHSIVESAPLHDIGKVGIPDNILLKPGKLTFEEFEIMKTHAQLGADALSGCLETSKHKSTTEFLESAIEIAGCHHEKWNGTGYPNGLSGTDIPLSARLMMLADVFDALISKRVYKESMTYEQAADIINDGEGTYFDPILVNAFNVLKKEFISLAALKD